MGPDAEAEDFATVSEVEKIGWRAFWDFGFLGLGWLVLSPWFEDFDFKVSRVFRLFRGFWF